MIVCDTSGLYAAYNANQPDHQAVVAAIDADPGPLVVSPYVLTELDHLLRTKVSVDAELGMLRDVEAGAYEVATLSSTEAGQVVELIEKYANRDLGIADAGNVVLAARFRTVRIVTLDERDYRIVRPLWGRAFVVLPADAAATDN